MIGLTIIFRQFKVKFSFVKRGVFILPVLFYLCPGIVESAVLDQEAQEDQWLKIMRYNKGLWGYTSEVDHPAYFLAANGKYDPLAEIKSSIEKFNSQVTGDLDVSKHPVCIFPGRFLYLKRRNLLNNTIQLEQCSDFQYFKKKIDLKSVSVIFSSFYINRPASAFGHTLFKLNGERGQGDDLRDYGVDYSAQVTTSNPFLYGIYGLMGGFFGRFSLLPYFLKLREYNDYESRDLWEFELNLSQDELDLFTAHLWDMNLALFDYFYLTENCSYHIMRFLDAIVPQYDLDAQMNYFIIPLDTLRPILKSKKLLKNIYYRPSLFTRVKKKVAQLSRQEKKHLLTIIKPNHHGIASNSGINNHPNPNPNSNLNSNNGFDQLSPQEQVQILDIAIEYMDYHYSDQIFLDRRPEENQALKRKKEILSQRSKIKIKSDTMDKKVKVDEPQIGHLPRFLAISRDFRGDDMGDFWFNYRFALHETTESPGDFYTVFSLEMGNLQFKYSKEEKKACFMRFDIANVTSLRPFSAIERKISWNFSTGLHQKINVNDSLGPHFDFGVGGSLQISKLLFGLFLQSNNHYNLSGNNSNYNSGHKESLEIGIKFLAVYNTDRWSFQISEQVLNSIINDEGFKSDFNFRVSLPLFRDYQLFLDYNHIDRYRSLLGGMKFYF